MRALISCLLLSILCSIPGWAQELQANPGSWGLRPGARGELGAGFLETVQRGDPGTVAAFLDRFATPAFRDSRSSEEHAAFFAALHKEWGECELFGIDVKGPGNLELEIRDNTGKRHRAVFELESGQIPRVIALDVIPVAAVATYTFTTLDEMDATLTDKATENIFSGVVLIARSGRIEFEKSYGPANKQYGITNTVDTRFNVASIGKMFTTVAALRLVQEEKLNIDAPISTYLDGFPPETGDRITVRHLLTHASGWGAYWDEEAYQCRKTQLHTLDDYLAFIRQMPVAFEPGTGQLYSNTGYEVLGAVIERASGMSYYDYVREKVFKAAGMEDTDNFWRDMPVPRIAVGYTNMSPLGPATGYERSVAYWLAPRGTPAGGAYSTARDLHRFIHALWSDELLDTHHTDMMLNGFNEGMPRRNGFGFAGGSPGTNSVLLVNMDAGLNVIVLSNYDEPVAEELGKYIFDLMSSRE